MRSVNECALTVMQSGDNPVINYLENEFKTLLSELSKMMPEEGDEWKALTPKEHDYE